MPDWGTVRRIAREKRCDVLAAEGTEAPPAAGLVSAAGLIESALKACDLCKQGLAPTDSLLGSADAILDRDMYVVWYNRDLPAETTLFNMAHELAHFWLHDPADFCTDPGLPSDTLGDPLPFAEAYVSGYSPAQRREVEANAFAAEFLLPSDLLRAAYAAGETAATMAARTGLSVTLVQSQLMEAVLGPAAWESEAPEEPAPATEAKNPAAGLDASQEEAACIEHGPVLIDAGPGTGKTRTLVARVLTLLERGVNPAHILALTFSNRAANEMRERLEAVTPEAARKIWIGTFHSFGLELLRRYGVRLGLPPAPALLDPVDAVTLLERNLVRLDLREYEYLHNPAFPMKAILSAISRAKDELISPAGLAAMADRMEREAVEDEDRLAAVKVREVAGVYAEWQQILQDNGKLDFGDLLLRSVELLDTWPDVLTEVRAQHREVLVDEYQDINRASAVMVQRVAGDGRGLWAVGDLRQAIYRFRGASPANVTNFECDYPTGRRLSLAVNYRTREPIVRLFGAAAERMREGATPPSWHAHRGAAGGSVSMAVAGDEAAQADGIAESIRRYHAAGVRFADQAVLCRTNNQADALASQLTERGIPILYLGNLITRPETRDMLALLSLASEGSTQGFVRVARFPEYDIPLPQVTAALEEMRAGQPLFGVLSQAAPDTSLARLYADVTDAARGMDAHGVLGRYLFGRADYLRRLLREDTLSNRQARMALHQVLLLAKAFAGRLGAEADSPTSAFLTHVRHLVSIGEDTRVRQPVGAESVDAVRMMTTHASKGLEFPVVYVPNLAKDLFPPRRMGGLVPLPPELGGGAAGEFEEESRLFFVALSRARDHLLLSRPARVKGRDRTASSLLGLIAGALESPWVCRQDWPAAENADEPAEPRRERAPAEDDEHDAAAVEQYMRCPRQYYYARVLRIGRSEDDSAYGAYTRCLWDVIGWLRDQFAAGNSPTQAEAEQRLESAWNEQGPVGHAHEPLLRGRAAEAIRRLVDNRPQGRPTRTEHLVARLPEGRIRVRVDATEETDDGGMVIQQYRTGKPSSSDHTAPRLALVRQAAKQRGDTAGPVEIQLHYLTTGEKRAVREQARWEPDRVAKYRSALRGIASEEFGAHPSQECARCPFYFVCPAS